MPAAKRAAFALEAVLLATPIDACALTQLQCLKEGFQGVVPRGLVNLFEHVFERVFRVRIRATGRWLNLWWRQRRPKRRKMAPARSAITAVSSKRISRYVRDAGS